MENSAKMIKNPVSQPRTLTERVYHHLKEQIINRELESGHRLVVSRVANELGTSFTPVRETLRLLEKDGLVQNIPHKGAVVTTPNRKQFEDIFAVRAVIEGLAARMACPWFTNSDFSELENILDRGNSYLAEKDTAGWIESDEQFHKFISHKYENAFHQRILSGILEHVRIFREVTTSTAVEENLQEAARQHRAIFDALKQRDAVQAEKLMVYHIEHALRVSLYMIS